MSIITFIIVGFPLDTTLPGESSKQKAPIDQKPFVMAMQFLSEEEKIHLTQKHDEIITILQSLADTRLIYLLLLNSKCDAQKNLSLNFGSDILCMLYNALSKDGKSEFEVLGKYITTLQNILLLYRIGRTMINFVFDE